MRRAPAVRRRKSATQNAAGSAAQRSESRGGQLSWPRTLAAKGVEQLREEHLQYRATLQSKGTVHCFLLDCSASMVRHGGLALAKALLLGWSRKLNRQCESLLLIGFAGEGARILSAPGLAALDPAWVDALPGGGGTPLAEGIEMMEETLRGLRRKTPRLKARCWLLSDGRITHLAGEPRGPDCCTLVDCEESPVPLGRLRRLAELWGADYLRARELVTHTQ